MLALLVFASVRFAWEVTFVSLCFLSLSAKHRRGDFSLVRSKGKVAPLLQRVPSRR